MEIYQAIVFLNAQRIGHGTTLLDNRMVLNTIKDRNICIEACPTSNLHTGVIEQVSNHPIKTWIKEGVKVAICADNTYLSDVTTLKEIDKVKSACNLSSEDIKWCLESAEQFRFD